MKKLIYCAAALAAMIFAGSCQQENLEPVAQESTVTFSVELPGVQTKAIGDGFNVDQLVYEVWKTENPNVRDLNNPEAKATRLYQETTKLERIDDEQKTIITLNLVHDQNYTILFWAQNSKAIGEEGAETPAYVTSDLTAVTYAEDVKNGSYPSNNENMAAFYGVAFLKAEEVETPSTRRVELKRPFAQLNIGTLNTVDPNEYKIEMISSKVTVRYVPTVFNVAENIAADSKNGTQAEPAVSKIEEFVFSSEDVPNKTEKLKVNDAEYEYAAMNYIFANGNVEVEYWIDAELTVTDLIEGRNQTTNATIHNIVQQVPLMENYRTNIVGNLLTSNTQYEVVIDADFNNPEYVHGEEWSQNGNYNYTINANASEGTLKAVLEHANAAAKAEATKAEGPVVTINLAGDVVWETGSGIGSTPLLPEDSPISAVVINGNGKTFTATGSGVGKIRLANGGKLTFIDVKIVDQSVSYAENSWEYGYLELGGVIRLEDCEVVNAIMVSGETAAFKNCSFNSNKDNEYDVWVDNGSAYFTDCTFAGARGLKIHEAYGSEVVKVAVDRCTFGPLSKKPGVAMGDLNKETTVTIKNSLFNRCQPGDQDLYIYETDTDVKNFTFVAENNVIIPSGDANVVTSDGNIIVATATGLKNAIESAKDGVKIQLTAGVYEGVFFVKDKNLTIEAYEDDEATINGKLAIAASGKTVNVKNIVFENSYEGSVATGHQYVDKTGKYCIGLYCASVNVEGCSFNLSDNGGINFYAINNPEYCTVKKSTFNCNGFRPILSKVNVTVDECIFNDQYKYALQVWGNQNNGEKVIFTNNFINEAGKTSRCADAYKSYVSVSKSYPLSNVAFTITDNTAGCNFVYDNNANVDITSCTLNGNNIVAGQCFTPAGVDDVKEVAMDYKAGYTYVGSAAEFTAALADSEVEKIALVGVIEGTFTVKRDVEVTSAGATATLKGRVNVANCNPTFVNVAFDRNETDSNAAWNTANGSSNCLQYRAVVMIYGSTANKVTFEQCKFYNNGGTHKSAITNTAVELVIDECYFEGRSSAIYTQANISMTNSTINYTGGNNVILSINGCGDNGGKVIFKNNKVTGDNIFVLGQFLSTTGFGNGLYHFDIQGNDEKFDNIFFNTSKVTKKEFADGSLTF